MADNPSGGDVVKVLSRIPAGVFVMTAAHDGARAGVVVTWVQRCSDDPSMVMVAMRKGSALSPLIRDSRGFALCQVAAGDRFLARKFNAWAREREDPFLSTPTRTSRAGAPVLERALGYLDCELVRHFDLDGNYEIYVGLVREAGMLSGGDAETPSAAD
jgi:flavin reductase (DIM6/NTAB) family NADH-FMN oxidoreductase RutF